MPGASSPTRRRRALVAALAILLGTAASAPPRARAEGEPELRRNAVVRAVERARGATVSIHTTQLIPQYFFDFELPPVEGNGMGSGAIFHPDGYVITNAHVLDRASEILVDVTMPDGGTTTTHEGRIFAVDIPNDLAILQLVPPAGQPRPAAYPYLAMGGSDDLMIGETVIAVGNPFNIGITVTTGVIGGLDRTLHLGRNRQQTFHDFIQIDAALSPGNSGGPLLDVTGRWIGVNTAIIDRRRAPAEGIGFAIPVNRVRSLVGRAFKRRLMKGDWMGLELEEGPQGQARVDEVFPKGPARDSGLRSGDVVVRANGEATPTLFDLRWQTAFLPRGSLLELEFVRGSGAPPRTTAVRLEPVPTTALSLRHLGVRAADVTERMSREWRVALDAGVVVEEVRPGSPAERIHLRVGDLITGLGSYRIRHTDDLLVFLQYVEPGHVVRVRLDRLVRVEGRRLAQDSYEGTLVAE